MRNILCGLHIMRFGSSDSSLYRGTLGYIEAVKLLTKELLYKLLVFDYNSAEMIINGVEDYLQGPRFINATLQRYCTLKY
jgi:hypothetical protein